MQYITPKDDTSTLSLPERTFLRSTARGVVGSSPSPLRLDGREPSEARSIRLSFARCHNRSECVVQFDTGTRGAASVWAELCPPPNADRPNDGQVKFSVDVGPMGCMGYEVVDRPASNYGAGEAIDGGQAAGGGPGEAPYVQRLKSNRILRILERTLLIGGAMDAEALCVQSGSWVWRLHVDVSLLDDGGNAVDACVLAAVASLRHYRLPEAEIGSSDDDDDVGYRETTIVHSDDREPAPLPLHHTPLTATFALFADESGTTSAVSALLDPSDREELACDGILTWSYNKYGEMCCLDFPGGCELRPRQLMASARLGKRRCVEVCALLEKALEEAEGKAQKERMERLNVMSVIRPSAAEDAEMATMASSGLVEARPALRYEDQDQTASHKEEEEYRLRALDYNAGHFAASVKEGKDKSAPQRRKNMGGETSSLFHAILRTVESSTARHAATSGNEEATVVLSENSTRGLQKIEPVVEIIADRRSAELSEDEAGKSQEKKKASPTKLQLMLDSDEDDVMQLSSEFLAVQERKETNASPKSLPANQTAHSDVEIEEESHETSMPAKVSRNGTCIEQKSPGGGKSRGKPAEEVDITDLTQTLKKKSKKSKKK